MKLVAAKYIHLSILSQVCHSHLQSVCGICSPLSLAESGLKKVRREVGRLVEAPTVPARADGRLGQGAGFGEEGTGSRIF